VDIQLSHQTKEELSKLKLYWALENLDLPVIQSDITIQKSEFCHLKIPNVNWYELRARQKMNLIDTGTLYLTNKRIIFTGRNKNSNIHIDKILDIILYSDGVKIRKETGKSPTLQMTQNTRYI
jgi:hypothetical protein